MKLKYVAIVIAVVSIAATSNASLQKPNWGIGDYWEYRGSYSVNEETSYENMSVKVSISTSQLKIKLEVIGTESLNIDGSAVTCYKTKLTSSSSGMISITGNLGNKPVNYNGEFDLSGDGYLYFTTNDLKVAKTDITMNISTSIALPNMPNGAVSVSMEYSPPLTFIKFPLDKGDKWTTNSTATISYGGVSSQAPVSFSFECIGKQGNVYIIKSGYNPFEEFVPVNNTLVFWDRDAGMIEEIKDMGGEGQSLDIKLISHKYSNVTNMPPVADFSWKPLHPSAGSNIFFTSNSHDNDGSIVSYYWEFGDGKTSTAANPRHVYATAGNYTVKLTVTDDYGATSSIEKTIVVGGGGGSSQNTPGFGILILLLALAFIIFRKKFIIFK